MNKSVFFLLSIFVAVTCKAQLSVEQIESKYDISSNWAVETDGSLSFSRIIFLSDTTMSKDAIFDKVQSYFSYNYVDGNSVIQAKDKESGYIIGRGYYLLCDDMYKYVKAEHIIKVDCKDGRIRVIITVNNYDEDGLAFPPDVHGNRHRNVMITTMYPFTKWNNRSERLTKDEKIHDEAFASLIGKVNAVFDDLKKTINKGSSVLDIDGW